MQIAFTSQLNGKVSNKMEYIILISYIRLEAMLMWSGDL